MDLKKFREEFEGIWSCQEPMAVSSARNEFLKNHIKRQNMMIAQQHGAMDRAFIIQDSRKPLGIKDDLLLLLL